MKKSKLLPAILVPVLALVLLMFGSTKVKAAEFKGVMLTKNGVDTTRGYYAFIYEVNQNSIDPNIPFIGDSNKFDSHEGEWSVHLVYNTGSTYSVYVYNCSADEITNGTKVGELGYYPYDGDGNRIADSTIISYIQNDKFYELSRFYWVKGTVNPKKPLTAEGSLEFTPGAFDATEYYLPNVVLKSNGVVINHMDLTPMVKLTAEDFEQETVEKDLYFYSRQVGGYKTDSLPKVTVHIPSTIDLTSMTMSSALTDVYYSARATGEQIIPNLNSDMLYGINNSPESYRYRNIRLYKDLDYDVTFENNIYPTTPTSAAVAIITFKGRYTGTKREYYQIFKGQITDAEASVSIENWTEGDTPSTPVVTSEKFYHEKNEAGAPVFTYYVKDTMEEIQGVPTAAGEYVLKAELPEGRIFEGTSVQTEFTVEKQPSFPPVIEIIEQDPAVISGGSTGEAGNAGGSAAVAETKAEEKAEDKKDEAEKAEEIKAEAEKAEPEAKTPLADTGKTAAVYGETEVKKAASTEVVEVKKEGKKYVNEDGEVVKKSLVKTEEGKLIYVNAAGNPSKNALVKVGKELYITDKKGEVITNKVVTLENGNKVMAGNDGQLVKKSFATAPNGKKVYADKNGVLMTGIFKVNGKMYYASRYGNIQTGKWVTVDGVKYYCNKNGVITKTKKVK